MRIDAGRERVRVAALIGRSGSPYTFKRYRLNRFNEITDELEVQFSIVGIFHMTSSFVESVKEDGTERHRKPSPMLLIAYCAKELQPKKGDRLIVGDDLFKVTAITDINEGQYALDVSLELINNG